MLDIRDRIRSRWSRPALVAGTALALSLAPAAALAQDAPGVVGIRVTDDAGRLLAVGDLDDGRLDVEALRSASGLATAVVHLEGGGTMTFDATIDPTTGEIVLFGEGFDETLAEYASRYGLQTTLEWEDDVDDDDFDPVRAAGGDDGDDQDDDDRDDRDDRDDDWDDDRDDRDDRDDDDRDDDFDDDGDDDRDDDDRNDDDRDDDGADARDDDDDRDDRDDDDDLDDDDGDDDDGDDDRDDG